MSSRPKVDGEGINVDRGEHRVASAIEVAPSLLQIAVNAQRWRAQISRIFPRGVFRDSEGDMLLELFVADQQCRSVCVKQLICASGETSTSALRRIDRLEVEGLLQRCPDADDNRRVGVVLTGRGDEAVRHMLNSLSGAAKAQ